MYCIIDFHVGAVVIFTGKNTEPELQHGVLVSEPGQKHFGSIWISSQIHSSNPRILLYPIPPLICDLALSAYLRRITRALSTLNRKMKQSNFARKVTPEKTTTLLLTLLSMAGIGAHFQFSNASIAQLESAENRENDLKTIPASALHKELFSSEVLEGISPRKSLIQRFNLVVPKFQKEYALFPLYDHFSRSLSLSAVLSVKMVYVYTTRDTWEKVQPKALCGDSALFSFGPTDKFLLIHKAEVTAHWADSILISAMPQSFSSPLASCESHSKDTGF